MVRKEEIIGAWLLVARGNDNTEDEQALRSRYGDDPKGLLIISPDGCYKITENSYGWWYLESPEMFSKNHEYKNYDLAIKTVQEHLENLKEEETLREENPTKENPKEENPKEDRKSKRR